MDTTTPSFPMTDERWYELDRHYRPAASVDFASAAIVECLAEIARQKNELKALEERRQYGADIITDMTLEAELADAHTQEAEAQLVALMAAVSKLRRMAVNNPSGSVSLFAIERELAGIPIKEAQQPAAAQVFPPACPRCNERPSRCVCHTSSHAS